MLKKLFRMKIALENACMHSTQKHFNKANFFTLSRKRWSLINFGFKDEKQSKIFRRKEDGISAERQSGSGRPAKIMTKFG